MPKLKSKVKQGFLNQSDYVLSHLSLALNILYSENVDNNIQWAKSPKKTVRRSVFLLLQTAFSAILPTG